MIKYIVCTIVLFLATSCVPLQNLPQTSLRTDVASADTKFSAVVTELHKEYNEGHICSVKLQKMQTIVRQGNAIIELAYDAALIKNFATVAKYITRLETMRRDLELDLEIAKSGEVLDGCTGNSVRTPKFTPAFA